MKFLYQPVRPFHISQKFGADQVCYKTMPDGSKQYKGKRTEESCDVKFGEGWASLYRRMKGHNGIDVRAGRWQPCYAAQRGTVLEISTDVNEGLGVVLKHQVGNKFYKTRYWHFIAVSPLLKGGDPVKTGQLLGYCDSTGRSTGDHLHFDLKEIKADNTVVNYDNGYFGGLDPEPYIYDIYALDVDKLNKAIELVAEKVARLAILIRKLI
jgi:murein DD-endopeptidase MepM/ murein hydrolase activator NlpD